MKHFFIDLFGGAGGVSTGAHRAGATVIAHIIKTNNQKRHAA